MSKKNDATSNKITRIRTRADDFILDLVADPSLIKQGFCPICKIKLIPHPQVTNEDDADSIMWCHGCGKTFSSEQEEGSPRQRQNKKIGRLSTVNSNENALEGEGGAVPILETLGSPRGSGRKLKKRNPNHNYYNYDHDYNYEYIEGLTPDKIPKLDKDHKDTDLLYHVSQGATILSVVDAGIIEPEEDY